MATAAPGKPPVSISLPDLSSVTESAKALISDGGPSTPKGSATPLTSAGVTSADAAQGNTDAGEALRARIIQQAESQQDQIDKAAQDAAEAAAAKKAVALAAQQKDDAEAKVAAAKKKADEDAKQKAEAARLAELAKSYSLPTSSYTLTSRFGDAGSMWSSGYHTGLDFAAPTGTLIKAVHSGTITEAGWAWLRTATAPSSPSTTARSCGSATSRPSASAWGRRWPPATSSGAWARPAT